MDYLFLCCLGIKNIMRNETSGLHLLLRRMSHGRYSRARGRVFKIEGESFLRDFFVCRGLGTGVVGGSWWRAGSGTVLWCGSIWEDTNTGCSFHHAYQHTPENTHTHTHSHSTTEKVKNKRLN